MYYAYKVGQVVEEFKNHAEETQFDLRDDGAVLLVFFNRPTEKEIQQFASGNNFEIRFTELYGVIMLTVKIGTLNWMDAPYTPHLSKYLTRFQLPNENEGLGLTVMLIDAQTGEIKHMRLLGLSKDFSGRLLGAVMEQKMSNPSDFDCRAYDNTVNQIYTRYTTKDIVKLSKAYCKINS